MTTVAILFAPLKYDTHQTFSLSASSDRPSELFRYSWMLVWERQGWDAPDGSTIICGLTSNLFSALLVVRRSSVRRNFISKLGRIGVARCIGPRSARHENGTPQAIKLSKPT